MKIKFNPIFCIFSISFFLVTSDNYCQAEKVRPHKLFYKAALYTGYDSNVNLSSSRNGDIFEECLLSLYFVRPWIKGTRFTFDYDLDFLNYNDIRDATSILHHVRLGVHKDLLRTLVGGGYDLGVLNYPYNDDGNFLFHKGFFYIRKNISRKMYHKVNFEYGLKDYTHNDVLAHTIATYQEKERLDRRASAEYILGLNPTPRLRLTLRSKFSVNNSNARFIDFYDYQSHRQSLSLSYKLLKNLYGICRLSHTRKKYDERTVTNGAYKEKDDLYSGTLGTLYKIDKNNSLSFYYTYRQNASNDPVAEYIETVVTCSLRHSF